MQRSEMSGGNPELEAAILASIDEPDAFLAYADWLQGKGDPRGELIRVQHALATAAGDEKKALKRQEKALFTRHPALRPAVLARTKKLLQPTWRLGYLDALSVGDDDDEEGDGEFVDVVAALEEVLAHPASKFLGSFFDGPLDPEGAYDSQRIVEALAKQKPVSLRNLTLCGGSTALWAALPDLRSVYLCSGAMTLGEIVLPEVRSFSVVTGGLEPRLFGCLAQARWPKLEKLEIWFGYPRSGHFYTVDEVRPLLASSVPALRHLALCFTGFTDELVSALAASPLLAQLKTLELKGGSLTNAGLDALVANKAAFAHLEKLDLSQNQNTLPPDAAKRLKGVCHEVFLGKGRR